MRQRNPHQVVMVFILFVLGPAVAVRMYRATLQELARASHELD